MGPLDQLGSARLAAHLRNKDDWKQLIQGSVDAIQIKSFATVSECGELLAFIQKHPRVEQYNTAAGIVRLGNSFSDIRKSGKISEAYSKPDILQEALAVNYAVSRIIGCITASWPHGLETYCYNNVPLHRSIARRIVSRGAEAHDDNIANEIPEDKIASTVQVQLGVNLYIEVPSLGGELEGWHRRLSPKEYDGLRNADPKLAYGVRRTAIGRSDWLIKPSSGDLIIFNNSELHAINLSEGARTTWGFFLGYRGDDKPLLIWS